MDIEKRERDIADWIGRPREPPLRIEDMEAEGEKDDVGATQASTEDNSYIEEYEEGREFDWEDDREDTVLSYAKNTKEEASSMHEGESLSSDSSDSSDSDDNDDDDYNTGAKDNTCYGSGEGTGAGDGGCDSTGAGGGSMEWMRFLSPSALSETLDGTAKAKASSSTKFEKNLKLGKSKNRIAWKGKAAKKLVKNSSKPAEIKKRGFTEGSTTITSREARSNSRRTRKKKMTEKKSYLASKNKGIGG